MNLPKIYQNTNIFIDNHNQEVYHSKDNIIENKSIKDDINNLFNSKNYIYRINVEMVRNNEVIKRTIIGKTNKYIITINNELIPINEITDIKKLDN